jgi:oligopeptide/dipeptide ABC transporter ATP-binding protein
MADKPILSIKDLKIYFNTDEGVVRAVDGVSFDVLPGQTVGIIGESGCGKSTVGKGLLRILDRNGEIVNGEITLNLPRPNAEDEVIDIVNINPKGKEIRKIRGGDIALIFQEPMSAFSPVHTIGNQMREMISLHQTVSRQEATDLAIELLNKVGVPRPKQRMEGYVWQLSGGLRQRTMIAMAISNNPKILICDEPTTSLDVTTQGQILDLLRSLQEEFNMSMIFITHNLGVIAEMADTVNVLYLGRNVESGTIDDIFHNPQHPYTKALLQSIPSISGSNKERLPAIAGSIPHVFNRPPGCPFNNRCTEVIKGTCDVFEPIFQPIGKTTQHASCFLHHPVNK